jgi:hypothetical protein
MNLTAFYTTLSGRVYDRLLDDLLRVVAQGLERVDGTTLLPLRQAPGLNESTETTTHAVELLIDE